MVINSTNINKTNKFIYTIQIYPSVMKKRADNRVAFDESDLIRRGLIYILYATNFFLQFLLSFVFDLLSFLWIV
jgi:hypothetical protein